MATCEEFKKLGNQALQRQDFVDAISKYTEAIRLEPNNHILYSNRSAAYCSSGQYTNAESDGRKCVSLKPDFTKGYGRIGSALVGLGKIDEAMQAYRDGLEVDPDNAALREGMLDCEKAKSDSLRGGGQGSGMGSIANAFGPQLLAKIAASPQHAHLLGDADFIAKLQSVQKNPSELSQHLQDPRFLDVLSLALGVPVQVRRGDGNDDDHSAPAASSSSSTFASHSSSGPAKKAAPVLTDEQKEALELKDLGNAAYKARDFDKAIELYTKATEKDPTTLVPAVNTLSVLLEMGEFAKVCEEADKVVERGREMRPQPFEMIGKAIARKGAAKEREGDLQGAIALYKTAMLEHRSADSLNRLRAAEKAADDAKAAAYIDKDKALAAKKEANEFFRTGDYPKSVELYSEAIKRDPCEPSAYTNRAAAYTKLLVYDQAIRDCDQALKIDPDFVRAMTRKARVYFFKKDYLKAMEWFDRALSKDPANQEASDGKQETITMIMSQGGSEEDQKQRMAQAMADPEVQQILTDPMMRIVLDTLSTDPHKGQDYLRDPGIATKLNKLIAAGVISMR